MISRRTILSGLAASTAAGCSARQAALAPYQYPIAPAPPDRATRGLDAVIDISRTPLSPISGWYARATSSPSSTRRAKATTMPTPCVPSDGRRPRRQDCCGAPIISARAIRPARSRQRSSWPPAQPRTLLALDLEPNEGDPSNSMTLEQAEAFVQAVARLRAGCRSSTCIRPGPTASRCQLRPQPRRQDHARLDPRALRPLGRRLP